MGAAILSVAQDRPSRGSGDPEPAPAPPPVVSSVPPTPDGSGRQPITGGTMTLLGAPLQVTIADSVDPTSRLMMWNKLQLAVDLVNAHAAQLTDSEAKIIKLLKAVNIYAGSAYAFTQESTAVFTVRTDYLLGNNTPWMASVLAHEPFHIWEYQQCGTSCSRGVEAEHKACLFQASVGAKFGLSVAEQEYLQGVFHTGRY
jgi:hypothetical protein